MDHKVGIEVSGKNYHHSLHQFLETYTINFAFPYVSNPHTETFLPHEKQLFRKCIWLSIVQKIYLTLNCSENISDSQASLKLPWYWNIVQIKGCFCLKFPTSLIVLMKNVFYSTILVVRQEKKNFFIYFIVWWNYYDKLGHEI